MFLLSLKINKGDPLSEPIEIKPLVSSVNLTGFIPSVVSKIPSFLTSKASKWEGFQDFNLGFFISAGAP